MQSRKQLVDEYIALLMARTGESEERVILIMGETIKNMSNEMLMEQINDSK